VTNGSHLRKAVYEAKSANEVLDRVDEFFEKHLAVRLPKHHDSAQPEPRKAAY